MQGTSRPVWAHSRQGCLEILRRSAHPRPDSNPSIHPQVPLIFVSSGPASLLNAITSTLLLAHQCPERSISYHMADSSHGLLNETCQSCGAAHLHVSANPSSSKAVPVSSCVEGSSAAASGRSPGVSIACCTAASTSAAAMGAGDQSTHIAVSTSATVYKIVIWGLADASSTSAVVRLTSNPMT